MSSVAWVASGKLFVKLDGNEPVAVESRYAEQVRARGRSLAQKNAWKSEGTGARFQRGGAVWGQSDEDGASIAFVTSLARGPKPGELVYALTAGPVGGVFLLRRAGAADAEEVRLFHRADVRIESVAACEHLIACTLSGKGGVRNLAAMRADGSDLTELTDGDAVDGAPAWLPADEAELVYHSAGIGRDAAGRFLALGPAALHKLHCESRALSTVAEDPAVDFLAPRSAGDGALYFIRRPYRAPTTRTKWYLPLVDAVLFVPRLVGALLAYLNFFGTRYTGRPLLNSGDAARRQMDVRQMMVWGNLLDAERNAQQQSEATGGDVKKVVAPSSWELCRVEKGQAIAAAKVLARGVAAYDVGADGTIVWSDGSSVYRQVGDGKREKVGEGERVHGVAVIA